MPGHDDAATGTGQAAQGLPADHLTVRAPGGALVLDEPLADEPLAEDALAGELLVEEISIDGMCGVY